MTIVHPIVHHNRSNNSTRNNCASTVFLRKVTVSHNSSRTDTTTTMMISMTTRKILSFVLIACVLLTLLQGGILLHVQTSPNGNDDPRLLLTSSSLVTLPTLRQSPTFLIPPQLHHQPRTCSSPEKDVPWMFGTKTCSSRLRQGENSSKIFKMKATMIQSRTSDHRCGFCIDDIFANRSDDFQTKKTTEKDFVQYLHHLSEELRTLKEKECSSLLVYGVAFGEQYTHWLTRQQGDASTDDLPYKMNPEQVQRLLQLHGPCFVTFVLAENLTSNVTQAHANDFVNQRNGKNKFYYSNDGLQQLIPIERDSLPYKSMRRNTKIFKMMGPSYIFGNWVQRVIWQDAKLVVYNVPNTILPYNYYDYFFNAIHLASIPRWSNNDDQVCASFMGLPYHRNTMGKIHTNRRNTAKRRKNNNNHPYQTVQFLQHCDTIIEASQSRPTISDDLHSVQHQCSLYYNQTEKLQQWSNAALDIPAVPHNHHNALDDALIDSAFIVWNLRSKRCQSFVGTLTCTWLDEIHCYSDRDQISFPYILQRMGLQIIKTSTHLNRNSTSNLSQRRKQHRNFVTPETHHRLFAHSDTPSVPLVHITKSSCHWYYNNLNDCDFTQNDPPTTQLSQQKKSRKRSPSITKWLTLPKVNKLAVIITGSFHRFVFQSSMQRFILPLTRQGHDVDYFLSLSVKKAPAYRSEQNYMNFQMTDPIFDQYIYHDDNVTLLDIAIMKERVSKFVQQQLKLNGANLQYISFQDTYNDMTTNEKVIERRQRARNMYPTEDPDLRFPIMDIRTAAIRNRTANANRNMLHLFYHIQHVYQQVLNREADRHVKYDYVLFLRDDTMWLRDFDFRSLIDNSSPIITTSTDLISVPTSIDSTEMTIPTLSSSNVEFFIPSCDARVPAIHPMEINDHIAIVKRDRADIYGKYFDELFNTNLDGCAQRLDDGLRYGRMIPRGKGGLSIDNVPTPLRGCNSEMILQYILEQNNVTIQKVGQGRIPFERMAFVKNPGANKVHSCFHKYCQSHIDPLIIPAGIEKCTKWN